MNTRAFYRAIAIDGLTAPYNTATLKVYYPALLAETEEHRNSGFLPADTSLAPLPVVIMMPGINVGPQAYGWLAIALAERGIVTVTYSLVSEEIPGLVSLSPGIDLQHLKPEKFGKAPTAIALAAIINELHKIQQNSVLKDLLALDNIILGGHSAGGTVALLNGNPQWFPGLAGVFSYAAHTAAAKPLGWPDNSYLPTPSLLPTLILGGENDGVIEGSQMRYGNSTDNTASGKLEQTFQQSISSARGDCHLAILAGANHFAIAYPEDNSTGRAFLDREQTRPAQQIRETLQETIGLFIESIRVNQVQQNLLPGYFTSHSARFRLLASK